MDLNSAAMAFIIGLGILFIIFGVIILGILVVVTIGNYKFFVKAGVPGWYAIIPFYNTWTLVKIAEVDTYWFLALIAQPIVFVLSMINPLFEYLSWVSYIAVVFGNICLFSNLCKKMHKDNAWLVCGILFGNIVTCVAGFMKEVQFDKDVVVTKNGMLDEWFNSSKK